MIMLKGAVQTEDIVLAPGDFYFGSGQVRLHTILGSCIAITMWHPSRRIGGMCHYLLPKRGQHSRGAHGHFADDAIAMFLREIRSRKCAPEEFEVKIFGGGSMFRLPYEQASWLNVPQNNINSAAELLRKHHFSITAQDVGGDQHRKIFFELWNGHVWMKYGQSSAERELRDGTY
jgi:chemotaxis protein CheD